MHLIKNHFLKNGQYQIIKHIGQGGFGITYMAHCFTEVSGPMGIIKTQIPVAIKEFFISDYCNRNEGESHITVSTTTGNEFFIKLKNKFFKEATIISKLKHNNIVSVFDIFEENNTVYMVMPYIEGSSLKELIAQKHIIDENTVLKYASQLCDAVAEIHRNNILHLDIKPSNILIENDGTLKLIDFGISKQYDNNHNETSTTPVGRSKGFAPPEQYAGMQQFSPVTDIYAMGATLYNMLTGVVPVESINLFEEDIIPIQKYNPSVSSHVVNAINMAMNPRRNKRPQSVNEFQSLLLSGQVTIDDDSSVISAHQLTDNNDRTIIQHTPNKTIDETFDLEQIYNISEPADSDSTSSSIISRLSTSQDAESTIISNHSQQSPNPQNVKAQFNYERPKLTIIEDEPQIERKWHEYGSKFEKFLRYTILGLITLSLALIFSAYNTELYSPTFNNIFSFYLWGNLILDFLIPIYLFCINFKIKEHRGIKILSSVILGVTLFSFGTNCPKYDLGYVFWHERCSIDVIMFLCYIMMILIYNKWSKNIESKKLLIWTYAFIAIYLFHSLFYIFY